MIRLDLSDNTDLAVTRAVTKAVQALSARTNELPWQRYQPFELVMSADLLARISGIPEFQGRLKAVGYLKVLLGLPVRIDPTLPPDVILVNDPRTMLNEPIEVH